MIRHAVEPASHHGAHLNTRTRSVLRPALRLAALLFVAAGPPALAADIYTDAITGVVISGNVAGNLGPFSRTTVDGPTHFEYTRTANPEVFSPGTIVAEGEASFGSLRAQVDLLGPSASYGLAGAYVSDVHTPTGGVIGAADTFLLVFSLDGSVDVSYNANDDPLKTIEHVARASISVNKYQADGSSEFLGGPGVAVDYFYTVGPGVVTTPFPPAYVSVQVPFVYGETFTLRTSLVVEAFTDSRFISTSGPPTFYTYGDNSIDRVTADFYDTVKLIAVVNDTTAGFGLAGQSGFDYQSIVTTQVPTIPEPGTPVLLALGCLALGAARWRRARSQRVAPQCRDALPGDHQGGRPRRPRRA